MEAHGYPYCHTGYGFPRDPCNLVELHRAQEKPMELRGTPKNPKKKNNMKANEPNLIPGNPMECHGTL